MHFSRPTGLALAVLLVRAPFLSAQTTAPAAVAQQIADIGRRESGWVRIHAADALCAMSAFAAARELIDGPPPEGSPLGYRIGIWRIRAQVPGERDRWVAELVKVAADLASPDRLFAVESLAKLGHVADAPLRRSLAEDAASADPADAPMIHWLLAVGGDIAARQRLTDALRAGPPVAKARAAYALRYLGHASDVELAALSDASQTSATEPAARSFVPASAYVLSASRPEIQRPFHDRILSLLPTVPVGEQCELCAVLGLAGDRRDLALLEGIAANGAPDVEIAARLAAWRIESRPANRRIETRTP